MEAVSISVVIPLFNKATCIAETLQSVLRQVFPPEEIIVVNDGSTDGGENIVKQFERYGVRLVTQKNQGVSAARNKGVSSAQGDYIAFLDADDIWLPWHLKELQDLIRQYPGAGVYSVGHQILREGKVYIPRCFSVKEFRGPVDEFFKAFANGMALVNSSTACMPRALFEIIGGFPVGVKKGEDVFVWIKAALAQGIVHSSRICCIYNQDAQFRSNQDVSPEVPYYLSWLDEAIVNNSLPRFHRFGAKKLLIKGVVFTAAGYRLGGNIRALDAMRHLEVCRSFPLIAYFFLLRILPVRLISFARHLRHARKDDI